MQPTDLPHMKTVQPLSLTAQIGIIALLIPCLFSTAQAKSHGQGLGRLLTTEFERARLDEVRFNVKPPKPYEGPPQLLIEGITHRPGMPKGQDLTIWIDRRAYQERELPAGLKLVRDKNGEVKGMTSRQGNGKLEFAKIGDFISRPQTPEEAQALAQAEQEARENKQSIGGNALSVIDNGIKKLEEAGTATGNNVKELIDKAKLPTKK